MGRILAKLGFAFAIKDNTNRTFFLNRKSAIHWLKRHGKQLPENSSAHKVIAQLKEFGNGLMLRDNLFPTDMIQHIAHFLLPKDLSQLGSVSRKLNQAAKHTLYSPQEMIYNLDHYIERSNKITKAYAPLAKYFLNLMDKPEFLLRLSIETKFSLLKCLIKIEIIVKKILTRGTSPLGNEVRSRILEVTPMLIKGFFDKEDSLIALWKVIYESSFFDGGYMLVSAITMLRSKEELRIAIQSIPDGTEIRKQGYLRALICGIRIERSEWKNQVPDDIVKELLQELNINPIDENLDPISGQDLGFVLGDYAFRRDQLGF